MSESTNQMQGKNLELNDIEKKFLAELKNNGPIQLEVQNILVEAVHYYRVHKQYDKALTFLEQLMFLDLDDDQKAGFQMHMGVIFECKKDYESAVKCYKAGIALKPKDPTVWYSLHNDLGYSLNKLGQHTEAEPFCRTAIEIDPDQHMAYQNFGVAAWRLGKYQTAAECLVTATIKLPIDSRSLDYLKELLKEQPQLQEEFQSKLELCEQAVKKMNE